MRDTLIDFCPVRDLAVCWDFGKELRLFLLLHLTPDPWERVHILIMMVITPTTFQLFLWTLHKLTIGPAESSFGGVASGGDCCSSGGECEGEGPDCRGWPGHPPGWSCPGESAPAPRSPSGWERSWTFEECRGTWCKVCQVREEDDEGFRLLLLFSPLLIVWEDDWFIRIHWEPCQHFD